MRILITGGAGYIGSHTLIALSEANYDFVVYDNLCNSSQKSLIRVSKIINKDIDFVQGDIRDKKRLQDVFTKYDINVVIHFAGLKAVSESVVKPIKYYDNNVNGTLVLLDVMQEFECKKIIFSSSATVYGEPKTNPIKENFPVGVTTNPYGTSKYMVEVILEDLVKSNSSFQAVILRYFNPVGAHKSGTIGEDPNGIPNNLMPFISQVAVGKREYLTIFGGDYDTKDGTGVRDYIHVVDLADAHVKALNYLNSKKFNTKHAIFNIGTGAGYSVLDMVKSFEKVSNKKLSYKIVQRRVGDIDQCFADSSLAKKVLGWSASQSIEDMCKDSWRWESNNTT